ncbi:MAG: hypothetical protein ABEK59_12285 [Halobacteria archaeon]
MNKLELLTSVLTETALTTGREIEDTYHCKKRLAEEDPENEDMYLKEFQDFKNGKEDSLNTVESVVYEHIRTLIQNEYGGERYGEDTEESISQVI